VTEQLRQISTCQQQEIDRSLKAFVRQMSEMLAKVRRQTAIALSLS
jgi:hypothetical protein